MRPESDKGGYRVSPVSIFGFPRNRVHRALLAAAILLIVAVFFFMFFPFMPALRIDSRNGESLAVIPLPDGKFVHHYTHSIHLSAVDEYFMVEGGKLRLYELRYDTTSVGMPSDGEQGYRLEDGRFILGMDREFGKISIYVADLPGHGIIAAGILYPFTDWKRPQEQIVISGTTTPLIRFRR